MVEGLLLIDKPAGWTSFDVVNYIRKIIAQSEGKKPRHVKVGHIGTLDPAATGLLVLCIGKYTKKVPEFMKRDKVYEVSARLGVTSTTGDVEGQLTEQEVKHLPTLEQVQNVIRSFIGEQMQTPPAFSAVKINGKRAYELARAGKEVSIEPRKVTIHDISNVHFAYPELEFTCHVSSGTYIRSLVSSIGESLKTGAYMTNLRRTSIGEWSIDEATQVEGINIEQIKSKLTLA